MPVDGPRCYSLGPYRQVDDGGSPVNLPPEGTIGAVDLRHPETGEGVGFFVTVESIPGGDYTQLGTVLDGELSPQLRNLWRDRVGVTVASTNILDALWETMTVRADPEGVSAPRPLIPTHQGVLELHLGGHSLVKSKRFDRSGPEWGAIQRVLHTDYRAIVASDPVLAAKVVSNWMRKYRINDPGQFIPPGAPPVEPRRPATTIADNFNRADQSGLGTSAEGWNWTSTIGTQTITSNRAAWASTTNAAARAESALSSADMYAQLDRTNTSTGSPGSYAAPNVRFHATTVDIYYTALIRASSSGIYSRGIGGVGGFTSLAAITDDAAACTTKIQVSGSTLTAYKNGVQVATVTDTTIPGNLRTGGAWRTTGDTGDNFSAGDLLASNVPAAMHHYKQLRA